jgi:hypothetical protein
MEFQSIFAGKALPEAAFGKKAVIDAHRSKHESTASVSAALATGIRFTRARWLHRRPRWSGKSGTSQIVSREHAKASAAPAASCKSAWGPSLPHQVSSSARLIQLLSSAEFPYE